MSVAALQWMLSHVENDHNNFNSSRALYVSAIVLRLCCWGGSKSSDPVQGGAPVPCHQEFVPSLEIAIYGASFWMPDLKLSGLTAIVGVGVIWQTLADALLFFLMIVATQYDGKVRRLFLRQSARTYSYRAIWHSVRLISSKVVF
ncbi:hypothetical protein MIH18_07980 [Marinobacter sp. M3C]|jgi:hypothetical protein|uniref:hypothetical protein n=1 Tax=unclassified Marinobacter TaxID=83889 RepID=UPI00201093DC|nr:MULTISPECIES: hypothetical protein [unclassified Marinobacter]MCL1482302.1 hypothetical protein [Marinobacter sp.]MCL1485346.1 hypothetical protein [Marinobacter sp.]MCL1486512.1 hypothetical protein [Marinobacter sp.]UQG56949.1 hypothetical protein MIH16_04625 [Marinobacter sp. M4C]UQG61854.1 hypothetical protein MIH18_07980 [Marinobacter sp. M3C]